MIEALKLFDPYNRQARLYPALITLLPAIFAALLVFPALLTSAGGGLVSILALSGGLYLVADLARSSGKELEAGLVDSWGGWPTTQLLRHSNGRLSGLTRERYRQILESKTNLSWPTPAAEAADSLAADAVYRSATDWLREQTRGPDFSLLLAENARYGFRRNLLGLKRWGIAVSLLAAVSLLGPVIVGAQFSMTEALGAISEPQRHLRLAAACGALLMFVGWMLVVSKKWVRAAAESYALALLQCCDRLK